MEWFERQRREDRPTSWVLTNEEGLYVESRQSSKVDSGRNSFGSGRGPGAPGTTCARTSCTTKTCCASRRATGDCAHFHPAKPSAARCTAGWHPARVSQGHGA